MENNQVIQKNILDSMFTQHRDKLIATISWHAPDALKMEMSVDDIFNCAYVDACKRLDYLNKNPEIPILIKLRGIVIQTIRNKVRYIKARKRNHSQEVHGNSLNTTQTGLLTSLADSIVTPSKKLMVEERAKIVRQIIEEMQPQDQEIIQLHLFERMDFKDCAEYFNINLNAVKMRYYRALKRLTELIKQNSELKS